MKALQVARFDIHTALAAALSFSISKLLLDTFSMPVLTDDESFTATAEAGGRARDGAEGKVAGAQHRLPS